MAAVLLCNDVEAREAGHHLSMRNVMAFTREERLPKVQRTVGSSLTQQFHSTFQRQAKKINLDCIIECSQDYSRLNRLPKEGLLLLLAVMLSQLLLIRTKPCLFLGLANDTVFERNITTFISIFYM